MAYPYPPTPTRPARPTTVTISSYLLYVAAAIQLISAVIELSQVGTMSRVLRDAYAGSTVEGAESVVAAISVASAVFAILFAAGLTILAIFNNRGRQGARVTTWVIGGVAVCCNGFGVLGNAATRSLSLNSGTTTTGPSATEVQDQLNAALPSWYNAATVTFAVLSLLCLLGAIVLLALPASNAFFRKPVAFDPTYGTGYGQQPPYPQAPYGGSPGAGALPAYGQAPYGQPAYGPPPASGQPSFGPPSAPPASGVPSGPPASGPPASGPPASGPPASGAPFSGPPAPGRPAAPGHPGPASDPWSAPPPAPPAMPPPASSPPAPGSPESSGSPEPPGSPDSPGSAGGQRPPEPPSAV